MYSTAHEPWSASRRYHEDAGRTASVAEGDASRVLTSHWSPAVDIREDEQGFTLYADLPGVDPAGIEITMERGVLGIRGERRFESAEERNAYHCMECSRGVFHRRFSLPDSVDAEAITARGVNGVLEVRIPKHQRLKPRRIPVG